MIIEATYKCKAVQAHPIQHCYERYMISASLNLSSDVLPDVNDLCKVSKAINVQEFHMTGCAVISDAASIVIVEGGQKAQKKYSHLMLNRIKWNDAADDIDTEEPKRWATQQNLGILGWPTDFFQIVNIGLVCELRPYIHEWSAHTWPDSSVTPTISSASLGLSWYPSHLWKAAYNILG